MLVCRLLLIFICSASALAHEIRPAIVDLDLGLPGRALLRVSLNLEAVIAEIGSTHTDTDQSQQAALYRQLRQLPPQELEQRLKVFLPRLKQGARLAAGNTLLDLRLTEVRIPETGDIELARESVIGLEVKLPDNAGELIWSWDENFGDSVIRVVGTGTADGYSAYLQRGESSAPIPLDRPPEQSGTRVFLNYLVIGFTHILPYGLDHILFVIGLFLLNARFKPLLWQVSSFTLAHTLTLALGIYGLVRVPPTIVEPLIAASIVYVCVENLYSAKMSPWRPLVVFAFGLLHGLGFAGVLLEIGLNPAYFATGLVAFNVGVELGQLAVIGCCFLGVGLWFRDKPWYRRRITVPASLLIAMIGSYWLVERIISV